MNILKAAACLVALSAVTGAAVVAASTDQGDTKTISKAPVPAPEVFARGGGRLGVSVRDVEDGDAKTARLSTPAGALVDDVSEDSPAAKAGLRKGDVIVEFEGERVRSARQLTRLVQETPDGRTVAAVVMRDGQRVTLNVAPRAGSGTVFESLRDLEEWGRNFRFDPPSRAVRVPPVPPVPPRPGRTNDSLSRGSGRLGITVDTLSPQLAEYFGTKEGVLVTSVQDGSAGAKVGLKAGDVITAVNGSAVDDPADLRRRLQSLDDGQELTVSVMRDKKAQTLKGKVEPTVRRRTYRSVI